ncbi:MAG: AAA family ATPase [Nostoc sp. CreGUA01]|nr:MoxR family ATPase [Nostoc sp. CreGUA01]
MLEYTGTKQPTEKDRDEYGQPLSPYLPSPDMIEAVKLTILLGRPLLLKGEPGCGKTQLARAVAFELGLPFYAWYVKSTSRARDGLYIYDTVARLRDAQLAASRILTPEEIKESKDPQKYRTFKELGQAFLDSQKGKRSVVLIDEIDKADIDFPNDLLVELDKLYFKVEETGEQIQGQREAAPIIFITSNDERDLPDAFLRRCLYHHVSFPDDERLKIILCSTFKDASPELVSKAIERFAQLRQVIAEGGTEVGKNVSTSELIDWFRVLKHHPEDEILQKLEGKIPFLGVLLKTWGGHQRYLDYLKKRGIETGT